jgi:hypothetical protein
LALPAVEVEIEVEACREVGDALGAGFALGGGAMTAVVLLVDSTVFASAVAGAGLALGGGAIAADVVEDVVVVVLVEVVEVVVVAVVVEVAAVRV